MEDKTKDSKPAGVELGYILRHPKTNEVIDGVEEDTPEIKANREEFERLWIERGFPPEALKAFKK